MRQLLKKRLPLISMVLAGLLVLAACADDEEAPAAEVEAPPAEEAEEAEAAPVDDDWPTDTLRFIASTSVGGGTDQLARALQGPLEDELGVSVVVDNRPGGNFSVTPTIIMNDGGDCETFMVHMSPFLEISYLTQEVDYDDYQDFATIVGITQEPSVLYVREDAEWQTLDELVEDARQRPGEITVGVTAATDPLFFALQEIEEELGVDFTIVPYEGGGPTRAALLAGEIDFMFNYLMTSAGIFDEIRILGLGSSDYERYADLPELEGVPLIDEEFGIETTDSELTFNAAASAECRDNHPDRYQALQDAFMAAIDSDAFRGLMEETGQSAWPRPMPGEEYDETVYGPSDELLRQQFDEAGLLVD